MEDLVHEQIQRKVCSGSTQPGIRYYQLGQNDGESMTYSRCYTGCGWSVGRLRLRPIAREIRNRWKKMVCILTWASVLPALTFELECFAFFLDPPALNSSSPGLEARLPVDFFTVKLDSDSELAVPAVAAAACSWYDATET
jgi:hypothetical protein